MLVWSGGEPRHLLGLFPARIEQRRYGLRLPVLVGMTHPYGPLGVPLVDREAAEPVIAAFFAHLAADAALPGLALLPFLPEDGPFAAALDAIVRRAQMPVADFNPPSAGAAGAERRAVALLSNMRLAATGKRNSGASGGAWRRPALS